jgi:hypothetical protein
MLHLVLSSGRRWAGCVLPVGLYLGMTAIGPGFGLKLQA